MQAQIIAGHAEASATVFFDIDFICYFEECRKQRLDVSLVNLFGVQVQLVEYHCRLGAA